MRIGILFAAAIVMLGCSDRASRDNLLGTDQDSGPSSTLEDAGPGDTEDAGEPVEEDAGPAPMGEDGGRGSMCPEMDLGTTVGIDIGVGSTHTFGDDVTPSCGSSRSDDFAFRWEVPEDGAYTIDTSGSFFDTVLHVREDTCDGAELACSDDAGGETSMVRLDLTAGQILIIVIDGRSGGYESDTGAFRLSISQPPESEEGLCDNGIDDDRDGNADCNDSECAALPRCTETECLNGEDDDGDGYTDCDDVDCEDNPSCTEIDCGDGVDNDMDGSIDCADYDCYYETACDEICDDGIDNDMDGSIDCADYECSSEVACREHCANGVDDNDDGRIDCDDSDCSGDSLCLEAGMCTDGIDNDTDSYTDCRDSECSCDPACSAAGACPGTDLGSAIGAAVSTGASAGCNNLEPTGCSGGRGPETTFSWTAPAAGTYTFDTDGSSFDTVISILDGDCSGAELDCNDDDIGVQSSVDVALAAGQTVVIVVDGYSATSAGAYTLNITGS